MGGPGSYVPGCPAPLSPLQGMTCVGSVWVLAGLGQLAWAASHEVAGRTAML